MALTTAFTTSLGLRHPIALAPMGGSAGGALAAAVSNGGGLGMVGGGRGDRDWLRHELALLTGQTTSPWGIGFLAWGVDVETVAWALEYQPAAMMLSFGDPAPFAERVRDAGAQLVVQVTDLDEARRALDVGADVIVAQGTEAGGHGGAGRGTLPFVPAVVDLASPVPVLAAGGIADGRGLAAALVLGAAGALLGTRFQASREALVPPQLTEALLHGRGEDTVRSRTLDVARGAPWPERYPARTLRNAFLERWHGREAELSRNAAARQEFRAAAERDDIDYVPVWAGEALDLITEIRPAADIVTDLATEAERALASGGHR
ncbi:NAD(P)H-dependent flavin oxidoreductase [Streptomyces silvisoli]|uniref:Nitronate monooxygenase n=1 Tax=Streptomyces silvisoli TaxID=3034235 RepID=A0ABT5ZDS4_9ACTN|nr:nitronate monooxygenase [Streptomyces silvisoli]MDF3287988.1 nitronate monooxygenase [Streptomyces silvisoli]